MFPNTWDFYSGLVSFRLSENFISGNISKQQYPSAYRKWGDGAMWIAFKHIIVTLKRIRQTYLYWYF